MVVSYLSIRNFFIISFTKPHLLFPNSPHIHLVYRPTIVYASVPSLLLA